MDRNDRGTKHQFITFIIRVQSKKGRHRRDKKNINVHIQLQKTARQIIDQNY